LRRSPGTICSTTDPPQQREVCCIITLPTIISVILTAPFGFLWEPASEELLLKALVGECALQDFPQRKLNMAQAGPGFSCAARIIYKLNEDQA